MLYVKNIKVAWNDRLLGHISGCFYTGQLSVIIGDNGVGKTTLLYHMGLLKETTGEYAYHQHKIDLSNHYKTHQFRYQNIYILLQELSLYDDMRLKDYLDLMSGNKKKIYDIPFPLHKKISDFSLGEKQYIFIYGGFLQDKAIYLLDEPTSALDKNIKLKIFDLFNQLKARGKIIIVISHDQDLINRGDRIYEFKNQQLILKKESQIQIDRTSVCNKISQIRFFKTRLYSKSFRYILFITILLSFLFLYVGNFIQNKENNIENQLINGTRQNIIIYSLEEPDISKEYCHKEPYYLYKYDKYTFINQALPIAFDKSKILHLEDISIEYYQESSTYYIKYIDPLFSKQQIGYLIVFDDPTLYPSIMKQLYNQYSFKDVQSLYLEKQNRTTLEIEMNIIIKFYYICVLVMMMLISLFYCRKIVRQNIQYILLLDLIGYTNLNKIIFFIYEIAINVFLSLIILWKYPFECFAIELFIIINYGYFLKSLNKDFSNLYRKNNMVGKI